MYVIYFKTSYIFISNTFLYSYTKSVIFSLKDFGHRFIMVREM